MPSTVRSVTRHFIGLPGFLHRLPLVPPEGADSDGDWYARQVEGDLQAGRRAVVRVIMSGRQVDLQLNPAALMWWYLASEEEQAPSDIDTRWPAPSS
jgi:hypothetical protein